MNAYRAKKPYKRGVVLQWTAKALSSTVEGFAQRNKDDRMIVLYPNEVILVRHGNVIQMDMYKSADSYVKPCAEYLGPIAVDKLEADRCDPTRHICLEFGFVVNHK